MLKSKRATDFTNPFSPNNFKKNDDIILSYIEIAINEINKLNWIISNSLKSQT